MLDVNVRSKVFQSSDGGELEAIRDLRAQFPPQSFTCMVGPSGCGKTTTLRIILGLESEYEGHVDLADTGRVSAVFQEPCLLPWRTVEQNVRLALPDTLKEQNLDDLFFVLGLSELRNFYPGELSLGLARRVSLARAFALEPGLMILDEPFVSLDDETAIRLRQLLMEVWSARPVTALMVTHNVREAVELSDRIIFLSSRPSTVVHEYQIEVPRDERDADTIDEIVQHLKLINLQAEGNPG